jgi:hypothetical protein
MAPAQLIVAPYQRDIACLRKGSSHLLVVHGLKRHRHFTFKPQFFAKRRRSLYGKLGQRWLGLSEIYLKEAGKTRRVCASDWIKQRLHSFIVTPAEAG